MKNERKNISVLHYLPRWDNGGMEHAVLDIILHCSQVEDYEICVAFLESEYAFDILEENRIKFTALYKKSKYNFKDCIKGLYAYLKNEQYDIVHCHINNAIGLFFAVAAKMAGVKKTVVHTHNNSFGAGKLVIKKILRKMSICMFGSIPDLYLACSNEAGRWTFGSNIENKKNYHVIYNGIDQNKFFYNKEIRRQLRKQYGVSEKFIVGHIGHFNYQKNQAFLLDTIENVSHAIPNICYFFVGSGETKKDFLLKIHERKLDKFVIVIDSVTNPQDYYSLFDVFAFPSHFEGFGLVMIEAQKCGLPVICSENVPRETAISPHVKFLSIDTEESVQQWENAIIEYKNMALDNERTSIKICAKYAIDEISREIEGYYMGLMGER